MKPSDVVDVNSATANMYGAEPCPKCGSEYRYPTTSGVIECTDCPYRESAKYAQSFGPVRGP